MRRLLPLVLLGCGVPEPVDGFVVRDDGAVELVVGERVLLSLSASGPATATFDETGSTTIAGIWSWQRDDETREVRPWGSIEPATAAFDGGTLTFGPGPTATSSTLTLQVVDAADSIALPLACDTDATFHGFGEQYNGTDQRGEAFTVFTSEQGIGREGGITRAFSGDDHTTYFAMPWVLDVRGRGLLLQTDHRLEVDLCASDRDTAWLEVTSGEALELVVFHGPTMADVVSQLGEVVGRPKRPPDWAFELWVSIQGGTEAVLAEVDRLEAANIPFSAVWTQDWTGFRRNLDGGSGVQYRWAVGTDLYEDLAGLVATIHDRGYRFLGYANPFVDADLDDFFPAMDEAGLLIQAPDGGSYTFAAPNGTSSLPDFTQQATRDVVAAALVDMVDVYGMDGWMSDFGEVLPLDAVLADGSDARAYHNRFPVHWHETVRRALDEARPDGDYVTFARSGWTGVQAAAMIHWVGDQEATWSPTDGLPTVVPAMINLGLSGQPFVSHDIAGFSGGPSSNELYLRWVELGAFTPVMRTHEGNKRASNWNWDGGPDAQDVETVDHVRRFARVHAALDWARWADEAAATGAPIVRHLALDFGDDPATHGLSDQYMLGDALLVAPVTTEGATSRELYLPGGSWVHVWTGDAHEGGQVVTVDAPIGQPAIFSLGVDRPDLRAIE